LFYRLNVVPILLPPLRERRRDIGLLAKHFLERAAEQGLPRKQLGDDAALVLEAHDWPGNVRELENMMRRIAVLSRDAVVNGSEVRLMLGDATGLRGDQADSDSDLATAIRSRLALIARQNPSLLDDGTLYDRIIAEVERPLIETILARHGHNQLRAARALGINRNTLRKRLDVLDIDSAGA